MKIKITKKYPYGIEEFKTDKITELGLKIIAEIKTSDIQADNHTMNAFLDVINKKCDDNHIWFLFGSNDKTSWIPLQAASKTNNVTEEIRNDFLCMFPYNRDNSTKSWDSHFYESVMEIDYGLERKCQKYRKIKDMCEWLGIAIYENEDQLVDFNDGSGINKFQKVECDIALKLKPLLWNPAGKEFTYLKSKDKTVLQAEDLNNAEN